MEKDCNRMKVKLVGHTQPVKEFEGLEDVQDLIAYCARVSNPSNQMNQETAPKLLNYLAKHKHWSPFEMASATMEIETTRDIARQMLRHRSFAFQEFSQRYADPAEFGDQFVIREARLQDTKNRQNSIDLDMSDEYHGGLQDRWAQMQSRVIDEAQLAYRWAIDNGIAKEQARAVLPEGNTVSRLYMQGSIRSWIHFIELRSGNGTQKEHMEVAREIGNAITKIFPLADTYINK
jgi:thymidylate synthase (FAD)